MKKLYSRFHLVIYLSALVCLQLLGINAAAQCGFIKGTGCPGTDYSNYGYYSTTNTSTVEYDNFTSAFHATMIRTSTGLVQIWGEQTAADGVSPLLLPTDVNSTNFPGLTGIPIRYAITSKGAKHQTILLTTTGLFAWGSTGIALSTSIKNTTAFEKITIDGKADGLPAGVAPNQVKMLFGTTGLLAIVTCDGSAYVLSLTYANNQGNGQPLDNTKWSKVKTNATTDLTNVIALRGSITTLMALTTDNKVYTWGEKTLLGTETSYSVQSRAYATEMLLPDETTPIKMIGLTSWDKFHESKDKQSANDPTYYLLYTNYKLYGMGNNELYQLGDFTTTNTPYKPKGKGSLPVIWVQPHYPSPSNPNVKGAVMEDVQWMSPKEHDSRWPAINILNTQGRLWNWGSNAGSMLGRTATGQDKNTKTPFHPGQPLANGAFDPLTSKVITVNTGGHTTMIIQECQENFGYVGHAIHGSTASGIDGDTYYPKFIFNTATITVCGTNVVPEISFVAKPIYTDDDENTVCKAQTLLLKGTPPGGTFSIISGPGIITDGNKLTFTGTGSSGSVVVRYTLATSYCSTLYVDKEIPFEECPLYKISGMVWLDTNHDAIKDAAEFGSNAPDLGGNGVWANLLDHNGEVIASIPVGTDGKYSFTVQSKGTYSVRITNTQITPGDPIPESARPLPYIWKYTGHNYGGPCVVPACVDPDIINNIVVSNSNVNNVNFGIAAAYSISGTVFHDPNGLNGTIPAVDGIPVYTAGSGYYSATEPQLYIVMVGPTGVALDFTAVKSDGTYNFDLTSPLSVTLFLTINQPVVGMFPLAPALANDWHYVGENFGINNASGTGVNDGSGTGDNAPSTRYNGKIAVSFSSGVLDITEVDFGIELPPVADPKEYIVTNDDFSSGAPSGYPPVSGFKYILMSSPKLVDNYSTNGSLTGTDPEDCATKSSCNGNPLGIRATFTVTSIKSNTKLYYDFGGAIGIQEVTAGTTIHNFDIDKMVIYGQLGQGTTGYELQFDYTITDSAGLVSPAVPYVIRTMTILPIDFISFEASKREAAAELFWTTTPGSEGKGFVIEYSRDGSVWDSTGFVANKTPNNNSTSIVQYNFIHYKPSPGTNLYRIKLVNFDGSFKYSTIRAVNFEFGNSTVIAPNPISDKINIKGLAGDETVIIYSNIGKKLYRQTVVTKEVTLPADFLKPGIYNIQIIRPDGVSTTFKVIKNQ